MAKRAAEPAKRVEIRTGRKPFRAIEIERRKPLEDQGFVWRESAIPFAERRGEARRLESEAEHYESVFSKSQAAESYAAAAIIYEELHDFPRAEALHEKAAEVYESVGESLAPQPEETRSFIDAYSHAAASLFAAATIAAETSPKKSAELFFRAAGGYSKSRSQQGVRSSYSHAFAVEPQEAAALCKKALPALIRQAHMEESSGNHAQAASLLFSAASLSELTSPKAAPTIFMAAGDNYAKAGMHGSAATSYSSAASMISAKHPAKAAATLLNVGESRAKSADYLGAALAFSTAIKLGAVDTPISYTPVAFLASTAESKLRSGSYFSAARAFFSAAYVAIHLSAPIAAGFFQKAGDYFLKSGKYEDAAFSFSSAARLGAGEAKILRDVIPALLEAASVKLESGDLASAASAFLSAAILLREPKPMMSAVMFERAGDVFARSGRNCRAASSYSFAAVLLSREDPERASVILRKAGECYGKTGSQEDAAAAIASAKRLHSGEGALQRSASVLTAAAEQKLKSGDHLDAARLFSSAAELSRETDARNSSMLFEKSGDNYFIMEKYCSAASAYLFAAILSSHLDSVRAMYLLGKAGSCYGRVR